MFFHVGHIAYLKAVKSYGEVIVVMLSSDERVKNRKGFTRPIYPENERAEILDSLKIVDYVFSDPGKDYEDIVKILDLDLYITDGEDVRFSNILDDSKQVILPRQESGVHGSTTEIINYIRKLEE